MEVIVIYKRGFFFKLLDEYEDVVGWRLIHRETAYGGLLAPILGIGSQFLVVALTLLGALLCHQVHPAKPSSLLTCGVTIFLLTGFIGGFSSARIYKTFRGKSWLLNAFLTATMVPGGIMVLISALSFMAWSQQSSLAISFNGWIMVAVLWMAVLLPGIVMGSHTGNQRDPIEHPVRPTQMPRIIPGKRWYQTYTASILLGGLVPFVVSLSIFMIYSDLHGKTNCIGVPDTLIGVSFNGLVHLDGDSGAGIFPVV